jgi:FkbM family methyltransferase
MAQLLKLASKVIRRGVVPLVPRKYRLPIRYAVHIGEGGYENELKYLDRIVPCGGVAVDVGANMGLFSYRLSKLFHRVHAFEINDDLVKDLDAYNPGNIEIVAKGLSSSEGVATLYIPIVNGRMLDGWASLTVGNCPEAEIHETKTVTLTTLDRFGLRDVAFVKIDVEGHEVEVLKGGMETFSRDRPVVLVEIKTKNLNEVTRFFDELGYVRYQLEDLIDVRGSRENYIFRPAE